MNTLLGIYVICGFLVAGYIVLSHLYATWKYIKQLYTAKYVRPCDIKTYFGFDYWGFCNGDFWVEVVIMSSLLTVCWTLGALIAWPLGIIFFLNSSIQKARDRIENGD